MSLVRITVDNWNQFKSDIDAIEVEAEYPIGTDFFRIDHGSNYFAFFERLGKLYYYAWLENGKAVAVAAGIMRPHVLGAKEHVWYLCDLKVHPAYRGRHIPLKMLTRAFPFNYLRCPRGYAISMDSSNGSPNRIVKLLKQFQWIHFGNVARLLIWSLNQQDMEKVTPILEKYRGPVSFLSLRGIKDIVLKSTGQPMNLLHAQFGSAPAGAVIPFLKMVLPRPKGVRRMACTRRTQMSRTTENDGNIIFRNGISSQKGTTHMFCVPAQDPLALEITNNLKMEASASASIISHRMDNSDWKWILTSDI